MEKKLKDIESEAWIYSIKEDNTQQHDYEWGMDELKSVYETEI